MLDYRCLSRTAVLVAADYWLLVMQREARSAKKELKTMFKEEAVKQHKRMAAPPSSIIPLA